jgi:hypothetical protein
LPAIRGWPVYWATVRLLPYDRLTLQGDQPIEMVEAKLASSVATRWFSLRTPPQPFRGTVKGRQFRITRVPGTFLGLPSRNSWRPVIVGSIVPAPAGTEVRIRFRLQYFVAAFMTFWFAFLFFGLVMTTVGPHNGKREAGGEAFGPVVMGAMAIVAYAMMSVSFWAEVKKAKVLLCECLGCREVGTARRLVRGYPRPRST